MKLTLTTFNLYQFAEPPHSFHEATSYHTPRVWRAKKAWTKAQLRLLDADVVAFQEVFSVEALRALCAEVGYGYFAVVDESVWEEGIFRASVVAVASRYPLSEVRTLDGFAFRRKPVVATLTVGAHAIRLCAVHLKSKYQTTDNTQRNNESTALCEALSADAVPTVLLGDFNDTAHSVTMRTLASCGFVDVSSHIPTNYFEGKGSCVDFVLLTADLASKLTRYETHDLHLRHKKAGSLAKSDHAQVVCELGF